MTDEKRGGRRAYPPEALQEQCDAYFAACEAAGKRCTRPGLLVALNLPEQVAEGWLCGKDKKYAVQAEILRRGLLRVIDALEQREDSKSVFLLKQPCYGGYRDKPEEGKGGMVDVKISFQGGDAFGS